MAGYWLLIFLFPIIPLQINLSTALACIIRQVLLALATFALLHINGCSIQKTAYREYSGWAWPQISAGNYHSADYFYYSKTNPSLKMLAPVNVAIQLGDGGTGITIELNSFYIFNRSFSVYTNFFYLINPVNVIGVSSQIAGVPSNPVAVETTADVNSVPDNYTLRAGVNYTFNRLVVTASVRYEGAPANDLFGKNDGLYRIGHIFSIEPGIEYKFKTSFLNSFITVPISRATIQTVPDKRATEITVDYTITGGDFASLVFFVGYAFTF